MLTAVCKLDRTWRTRVQHSSRGIQTRLVVFKSVSWYTNPSRIQSVSWYPHQFRGIQIRLVVFKSVSWYSIRQVVSKSVSCYLNPTRGIQIPLVVFKFISRYSNRSRGGQIRLPGTQICSSFKVNSLRQYCG